MCHDPGLGKGEVPSLSSWPCPMPKEHSAVVQFHLYGRDCGPLSSLTSRQYGCAYCMRALHLGIYGTPGPRCSSCFFFSPIHQCLRAFATFLPFDLCFSFLLFFCFGRCLQSFVSHLIPHCIAFFLFRQTERCLSLLSLLSLLQIYPRSASAALFHGSHVFIRFLSPKSRPILLPTHGSKTPRTLAMECFRQIFRCIKTPFTRTKQPVLEIVS